MVSLRPHLTTHHQMLHISVLSFLMNSMRYVVDTFLVGHQPREGPINIGARPTAAGPTSGPRRPKHYFDPNPFIPYTLL